MSYPISIKGVVVRNDRVLLLKNDRDEWELPGGRIEQGETPEQFVAREIAEETRWKVITGPPAGRSSRLTARTVPTARNDTQ